MMIQEKFNITGMSCINCARSIENNLKDVNGIKTVQVNLITNSMTVNYDKNIINNKQIIKIVEESGYGVVMPEENKKNKTINSELAKTEKRLIFSTVFLLPLLYLTIGSMFGLKLPKFFIGIENSLALTLTQFVLSIPIVYLNRNYYINGFRNLKNRTPNMDSLIAVGSGSALFYSIIVMYQLAYSMGHNNLVLAQAQIKNLYFEATCMIIVLITLGKYLETRAKNKTSNAINLLLNLVPKTTTVIKNNNEFEIPITELKIDDIVFIRPGQSIPADGTVIEGVSDVDESVLTGESLPVSKNVGYRVSAGTINNNGSFKFKVEKIGNDTILGQIVKIIENSAVSRVPIAQLADKISSIFVPIVIGLSLITLIVWLMVGYGFSFALSKAIAVLVISCPCALGLATPVAIVAGAGKAAEYGILIKSASVLEIIHNATTVVLDKTGTITEGKPQISKIISNSINENELLQIAASIENLSEHPLASIVVAEAKSRNINMKPVENFKAVIGNGVTGIIENKEITIGSESFMKNNNISVESYSDLDEKSVIYIASNQKCIGAIYVSDKIKENAKTAIDLMKAMNLEVIMLTGDNKKIAEKIAKEVAIDNIISEVLPQNKEETITKLQENGKKVIMVGDGINDAPALAVADIGIAIGTGTDIAIESADLILMRSNLMDVITAIKLGKSTLKIIKQNLFWAFIYNILGIPLAAGIFYKAFGWELNPMFAAFAMSISSLCVVSNALRLKFFKA